MLVRILIARGPNIGGAAVATALLRQGLVDKLVVFIAHKILGKGIEAIGDLGIKDIDQALNLSRVRSYRRGEDMVVEARLDNAQTRKTWLTTRGNIM